MASAVKEGTQPKSVPVRNKDMGRSALVWWRDADPELVVLIQKDGSSLTVWSKESRRIMSPGPDASQVIWLGERVL